MQETRPAKVLLILVEAPTGAKLFHLLFLFIYILCSYDIVVHSNIKLNSIPKVVVKTKILKDFVNIGNI